MKAARLLTFCSVLLFMVFAPGGAAFAQSGGSYIFPGITTNNDITIGNLNPQPTTATISFYDSSGKLSSLSVELASGAQTRVNPNTVGLTSFTGSVVVSGPVPLTVSGEQFEGSTAFDLIYPSDLSTNLLIPFAPTDAGAADVSVFNPGPNQAEVKIVLVASDGAHNVVRTATLDPLHSTTIHIAGDSAAFMFVTTTNVLRPTAPVAASAVVRDFTPPVSGAVKRTDFAVVPAIPQANFNKSAVQIPFYAQGPDYFTVVQLNNISNIRQTLSVTATRADGTPLPGTNNPAQIVLPAYGSIRQEMATMFGSTSTGILGAGLVTVTSLGSETNGGPTAGAPAPITAVAAIGNIIEPGLAVVQPSSPQTNFSMQLKGTGPEFFSGLSLQNPAAGDAHISFAFVLDQGTTLASTTIVLPHGQQQITTLGDLLPEAAGNGCVVVKSDVPIVIVGIDGRSDNSALAARLPEYVAANFTPPPQQSFSIAGTVRDPSTGVNGQNIGVPDVAFSLSGGAETTTATDQNGRFVFRDLAPGAYTITPLPVGYTTSPGGQSVVITNSNSRGNDFTIGLTTPGILKINPASAQVVSSGAPSSAGIQITIQGSNFVPSTNFAGNVFTGNNNKFTSGSTLVFADSQVPTAVSSPTFLTASVSPSLLVTTGTVSVRVRNLGPSGDFVDSPSVSFTIGSAPPTLTSVTNVPSPLIVGQVTNSFNVTVNGAGFTPATRVRVNFVDRPTTYVNQNQVIGTVLPGDLTIPGFVPITVQNPNTVDSTAFQLPVLYPIPVVTQISPNSITAQVALNAQPLPVTITGTNFSQSPTDLLDTATVQVNGATIPTQYVSTTQLAALIPANLTSVPGVLQVTVVNPQPNLAPSNVAAIFIVNPIASISAVDAGHVTWNPNSPPNSAFNQQVVITGANFAPNAVAWVNPPCDTLGLRKAISTVRNSSTQIIATISIRCAGNYQLQIENPQPGGGLSPAVPLVVPSVAQSAIEVSPFIPIIVPDVPLVTEPDLAPAPSEAPKDATPIN
jgi:hypothetical protein